MCMCVCVCIVIAQWVACLHKEPSSEPQILIFPNEIIRILFQTMQSLSLCRSHSLSQRHAHNGMLHPYSLLLNLCSVKLINKCMFRGSGR